MSLSRVPGDDELYIGGIFTLRRRSALEDTGITHVVSVLRYDFKDFPDGHKFQHCSVQVDDVDDENLLGEFPRTNAFIASALAGGGKVFVHWQV
ncbi:MAG: tyrosine protein phosphatase yvh1 [Claussenomyces sp. TS43310]|nr:MAG: tyrosine protein phosphatase yvh1 [Claussenomyces sp. TS43310]